MRRWWTALALLALAGLARPSHADVNVSIRPQFPCVRNAETFTATLELDSLGSEIDGYEVLIHFDGDLLDIVSIQEGPLMTHVCQSTWWYHTQTDSTVFISHVLLCGGLTVTGPGTLSSITFRATGATGDSPLHLAGAEFYRAGEYVTPVYTHDGAVSVGSDCLGACCLPDESCRIQGHDDCENQNGVFQGIHVSCDPNPCPVSGVGTAPNTSSLLRLEISPNPLTSTAEIEFDLPIPTPATLTILDSGGRLVRTLIAGALPSGRRSVGWNGRDDTGTPVPNGIYFCAFRTDGGRSSSRVTVLR
jgi:hypothetical protein